MTVTLQQREKFLDTEGWANNWARDESDKAVGESIIEALRPCMLYMLDKNLAWKTLRKHQGYLRLLGAMTVDVMTQFPEIAPKTADEALDKMLDGCDFDSYPELRHASRAEQREFETTCRLVFNFREANKRSSGASPGSEKHHQLEPC